MRIEELDATDTPIGVISLRRRFDRVVGHDVYEVKIDDEFLMSSLFTVVEQELAHLALACVDRHRPGPARARRRARPGLHPARGPGGRRGSSRCR